MSQGAEKSQLPEVGIERGPQDLKANTLPRRCKSRLLPQGTRSVLYTYPYYIQMGENETLRYIWLHMVHNITCVMLKQQFFEIKTNTQNF